MMAARAEAPKTDIPDDDDELRIEPAAKFLGVSTDFLYDRAQDGTVKAFKLAGKWRFLKSDLRAYKAQLRAQRRG